MRRRLRTLRWHRPLLLMFLLLALLHLLLLLNMLLSQVLKLFLLLLLHLLPALVVGFLLIGTLTLLRLLLFDPLALLVLLSVQIFQLLLMPPLQLRIAVWWCDLSSRRWPIVLLVVSRLIGLHIRWLIIRPCRWRPIIVLIIRRRGVRPVNVGIGRPVILRSVVVRLLTRTVLGLWRYRSIVGVLLRSSGARRGCHPHRSLRLLLLLNLAHLRDRERAPAVLLNGRLLPVKSRRRRWRSALGYNCTV